MRIGLTIFILICLSTQIFAQADLPFWSRVMTTNDQTKVDLDNYYAVFSGKRSGRVRFRWLYLSDQQSADGTKFRSELNEFEFDCKEKRYRIHRRESFDKNDKSVYIWESTTDTNWKPADNKTANKLLIPACWLLDFRRQNPVQEK